MAGATRVCPRPHARIDGAISSGDALGAKARRFD
jgi:hypothetical protein